MPKTKKTDLSATRGQRGGRRRQRPERAGRASSSTAAEQVAQPPVENQTVASHSPQPSTAPMLVAPSITVAGPTDAIGSSQQESTEMAQGTNIGAQSQSLMFGNNFSQPVINNSTQVDLGYHVDNATKQKIVNGEYINLATLLVRDANRLQLSTLSMDSQGQIIAQPKHNHRLTTIEKWTDAFIIYACIYLTAHPSKTHQLFKYMHDVRLGAEKSQGWVTYDEQYRLRMAINPSNNWGVIDSELWLVYMTPGIQSNTNRPSSSPNKCFDFNYRDSCNRIHCAYLHQCIRCNNKHPLIRCMDTQTPTHPIGQSFRGQGFTFRPSQFQSTYQPRQVLPQSRQFTPQPRHVTPQSRHVTPQSRQMGPGRFPTKDTANTGTFN